jgi:hypothetical protein
MVVDVPPDVNGEHIEVRGDTKRIDLKGETAPVVGSGKNSRRAEKGITGVANYV